MIQSRATLLRQTRQGSEGLLYLLLTDGWDFDKGQRSTFQTAGTPHAKAKRHQGMAFGDKSSLSFPNLSRVPTHGLLNILVQLKYCLLESSRNRLNCWLNSSVRGT